MRKLSLFSFVVGLLMQFSALAAVPSAPTGPKPGGLDFPGPQVASQTVFLSWTKPAGATYYALTVRDLTANQDVLVATTGSSSYAVKLLPGKFYAWKVAAGNMDGLGPYTANNYLHTEGSLVTRLGLDYAFTKPTATGVKNRGYTFVVRYVGGSAGKQISLAEANSLKGAGIDLILVFESTAGRIVDGYNAGVTDANTAISQARAAGAPVNFFCYFACDFDAQLSDQSAINAYLDGVASVFGGYQRIGFYGGFNPVKRVLDAGKAAKAWQTVAWSAGQKDPRITMLQTAQQVTIDGATCDVNEGYGDNLGQWATPVGSLQVNLAPAETIPSGAQWRVDNDIWRNSGATIANIPSGLYTLNFKSIPGWNTPAAQTVLVNANQAIQYTASYTEIPPSDLIETTIEDGAINFTLKGQSNTKWEIQSTADFKSWQPLGIYTIPAGGILPLTDANPANLPAQIYRAVLKP